MRSLCAVLSLTVALATAACTGPDVQPLRPAEVASLEAAANHPHGAYRLEPGDSIRIRYTFHSDLDQEARIRPDGKFRASEVGEIEAAGRTATELAEYLKQQTSGRLRDPEVVVSVTEFAPKTIFVAGEVGRPGRVPYRRGLTALQAVIEAGGFADTARIDQVVLVRADGAGKSVSRTLDVEAAMKEGEAEPIFLAPYDVVFVPRTTVAEANVWVDQHVTQLFPVFRGASAKMDFPQN
jgi:protein involved in polysaccharide export with SLBB domain